MVTLVREVISFMWLYIIYQSLLIRVYVKKETKKKKSFICSIVSFFLGHVYVHDILLH